MPDELDGVLDGVAPRLRALRARRGLTLVELSEQTGISVSTLSRLESGGRRPTLDLLIRLAGVYRVSLDDLVGAPQIADPRVHPKPFYREGRAIIPFDPQQSRRARIQDRAAGAPARGAHHDGRARGLRLDLRAQRARAPRARRRRDRARAGRSRRVRHPHPARQRERVAEPAEVINLLSTQGERVHVRGGPA